MLRVCWSELPKLRRWSVLAGGAAIILFTAYIPFFLINQVTGGHVGPGTMVPSYMPPLLRTDRALPALLGVDGQAPAIVAIVLILVSTNIGLEWSQGTLRNLLIAQPARFRLLAGKLLTVALYVVVVDGLALALGAAVAVAYARSRGIDTTAWTSGPGIDNFLSFLGNSVLGIAGVSLLATFISVVIAVLTRSAAAAVGISMAYALAVEALLTAVLPNVGKWLPINLFQDLVSVSPAVSYSTALIGGLVWMLAFVGASLVVFARTDVLA
jgi:ABC-type transport system involved in multi-copper enzyme maturation permease subunit